MNPMGMLVCINAFYVSVETQEHTFLKTKDERLVLMNDPLRSTRSVSQGAKYRQICRQLRGVFMVYDHLLMTLTNDNII